METEYVPGTLRVCLLGELDHHAARSTMSELEDKLDVLLPSQCVLDLGGVTFMDSSGIAVVLKSWRRMNELGGSFRAENVPEQAMRVLTAAGLDRMIDFSASACTGGKEL